jgi:hypothetical protein
MPRPTAIAENTIEYYDSLGYFPWLRIYIRWFMMCGCYRSIYILSNWCVVRCIVYGLDPSLRLLSSASGLIYVAYLPAD